MKTSSFLRFCACLLVLIASRPAAFAASGNDNPTGLAGGFSGSVTTGCGYDAYTGSASRTIVDLQVAGAVSSYPLTWARTMNTRSGAGKLWKNSWSWSITPIDSTTWSAASPSPVLLEPPTYTVNFPDGRVTVFTRYDEVNDDYFHAPNGVTERLQQLDTDKSKFYLRFADGGKAFFQRTAIVTTGYDGEVHQYYKEQAISFKLVSIIDPFNRTTAISYDSSGRLDRITDPSGRYLDCTWTITGSVAELTKVTGSDGQWVQFAYNGTPLNTVIYSDETPATITDNPTAVYTYQPSNVSSVTGSLPLIFKDVRYAGAMSQIKYEFATGTGAVFGQIKSEKLPASAATGNLDVTVSTYDLATHTETRGDDPTRSFTYTGYNLTTARDFKGIATTFGYDSNGFRTSVKDILGQTTTYVREPYAGQITKVTYPKVDPAPVGAFVTVEYSDQQNPYWIKEKTDERGNVTVFTRDPATHLVTRIDHPATIAGTAYETFGYNGFGQVTTHRLTNGSSESFHYDATGLMDSQTNAMGQVTTFTYDAKFRLKTIVAPHLAADDPLDFTTTYLYNERGQVIKVIDPNGTDREYTYDDIGNRLTELNEFNKVWTYTYDLYNRMVTAKTPLGHVTTTSYIKNKSTPYNHTTRSAYLVTSPAGRKVAATYDNNFAPLTSTRGSGSPNPATSSVSYNTLGQADTATDGEGKIWTNEYDPRGRQETTEDPLRQITTWTYDNANNVLTTKLADDTVTTNTYDEWNHPLTVKDPLGKIITLEYDLAGNMTLLKDKNLKSYTYLYDKINRRTRQTFPDTTYEESTYNPDSTLRIWRNRWGQVQTYTYDIPNRKMTSSWSSNGDTVDTIYDLAGRVTDVNGTTSDLHYTYDDDGRQLTERQTIVGLTAKTVTYAYDNDDNVTSITYPDGNIFTREWTPRSELLAVKLGTSTLASYVYDDNSSVTHRAILPASASDYEYNDVGKLDFLSHKHNTTTTASFDYGYNEVNNRTYVKYQTGRGDHYDYDKTQQLTVAKYNGLSVDTTPISWTASKVFNYNPAGNRNGVDSSGGGFDYAFTSNPNNTYATITGVTPASTPTYDLNGNSKIWSGWTYTHDANNKLTSADKAGVATSDFYRDPLGRIATTVINGVTTYNVYDGWNIILRYNASGVVIDRMTYGAGTDELVTRSVGSAVYYYLYDGLGSVCQILDASGNLAESYTYDVYGAVTIKSPSGAVLPDSAIGNRYFFTGREYITEIDLYDYRNRTYSAELGRFLEPDPLGFAAGDDNMYRYCGNNPVNGIDPWGLTTADDVVFKKTEAGGTWDVPEYGTFENSAIEAAGGAYFTFEDGSTYSVGGTLDTMSVTAGIHSSQGLNDSGTGFEGGRTFSGGDGGRRGSAHSNSADNTFVWDKSDFTKLAKQMKDNQMPEFGAIVDKTVITGSAVEVGALVAIEYAPALLPGVYEELRKINIDGPGRGGRIVQLRYQSLPVVRLEYGKWMTPFGPKDRLHLNIGPTRDNLHISLDPRSIFDQ